jgi:hypothetical protein
MKPPFVITPEAEAHITERAASSPESVLVPTLHEVGGYEIQSKEGKILERYFGEHYVLSFYRPDQRPNRIMFAIGGHSISIVPETLKKLENTVLDLIETEVGYPEPFKIKRKLLKQKIEPEHSPKPLPP